MSVVHCLRLLSLDYQVGICVLIGDSFFLRSLILAYILLWMLKCDPYVSPRILHHLYSSTNRVNKFLH